MGGQLYSGTFPYEVSECCLLNTNFKVLTNLNEPIKDIKQKTT